MKNEFLRLLIIAAHPDDEILGCGGLISKYKDICEFKVLFLGEGSSSRFEFDCEKKLIELRGGQ